MSYPVGNMQSVANLDPGNGAGLPPALRTQLLDPSVWHDALEKYAVATNLAVALTGADGSLLAECINPQPTWSLLHPRIPAAAGTCPFALMSDWSCTCVADCLTRGGYRIERDPTGLVHFAVPLLLDGQALGAVVAGQVFDQYPEELAVEHMAKATALGPKQVWQQARLEVPLRPATLRVYADLLATLADDFLRSRYHTILEAERLAQMTGLRDQLRERTQELSEANRRKDEFLAMLAHELRNPLAPIRNAAQVIGLLAKEDGNLRWAGEVVQRQAQHMSRLVDDLLDVSRFTSGKVTLHKEATDLAAVVARAIETARPAIEGRRHEFSVTLPPERLRVEADTVRLAQVLDNLLNNAAKYTPEGGRITLTAEQDGRQVAVRVRDTGIGIPADMLTRVFDLFTQVDRALDHGQGGLGIGLTLVKKLVELHGGTVEVSSGGLNQGSEFVVRLPLLPSTGNEEKGSETENDPSEAPARRRVLVVDDNVDAADSLAKLLELNGQEVRVVNDGPAALEATPTYRPEVVLLDIGLPRMDGFEVARRLREQPATAHALLVALTGYGREEDRRRSRDAGFDHHLVKPVEPQAILRLLALPLPHHAGERGR